MMNRAKGLFKQLTELDNLVSASHKAFMGKQQSNEVRNFQQNYLPNITKIRDELLSGIMRPWSYRKFIIYEPKKREICAAPVEQRIIHHAIINVCQAVFEKYQIYDSYASRSGKGVHKAILRLKKKLGIYKYYAKLDVRKFFDSVDHDILKILLERLFKEEQLLRLLYGIIDSHGVRTGLPIGNLTSQYFANHYLARLDHYMKEDMKAPFYIRYMDDVVILSNDKMEIKNLIEEYVAYAKNKLRLELNLQL